MLSISLENSGRSSRVNFSAVKFVHKPRCKNALCSSVTETCDFANNENDQFVNCKFSNYVTLSMSRRSRTVVGVIGTKMLEVREQFIPKKERML